MTSTEHNLDLSQPLAPLLKDATKKAHEQAETSQGARLLLSGQLPKEQYIQFLMMLWHVYDTFERALDRHSTYPTLEPTYNPSLFRRTALLSSDISYLLQVPTSTWQKHPLHISLLTSMPTQLRVYVDRINTIANSPDPSALLAHSYVRYLGDLSGGQFIRRVIVKAYELDETTGLGVEFYEFRELGGSRKANQGDMKKIKEWFREGMNTGALGEAVKAVVINEASLAFELNTGLFEVIETMAVEPTESTPELESSEVEKLIVKAPFKANTSEESQSENMYSVASVAAFIAAACLAHFIIVVGGFSGARGYQKLLAIERWVSALF